MRNFNIQGINYNFTYNPINNIPQKYIQNVSILNEIDFSSPTILPIEPNVPNEVPIVIVQNEKINAQIVICKGSLSVSFPFTPGMDELISNSITVICDFVEKIIDDISNNMKYCGLSVNYFLEEDSAINSIKKGLLKIDEDLCDVDITYTNIKNDHYYINKKIANTRIYSQSVDQRMFGFLKNESHSAVLLNIDVNSRYAFNIGKKINLNLKDEIKTLKNIADCSFNETKIKIKGVIDNDD